MGGDFKYTHPPHSASNLTSMLPGLFIAAFLAALLTRVISPNVLAKIGYDNLTSYYFGAKKKAHMFCKTCGSSILIDFKRNEYGETDPENDKLAINVCVLYLALFLVGFMLSS